MSGESTRKSMTRTEARQEACFRAALVIETALEGGWETLDRYGDDRELVEAELNKLAASLLKRSGRDTS